jgi:hypothetical protein
MLRHAERVVVLSCKALPRFTIPVTVLLREIQDRYTAGVSQLFEQTSPDHKPPADTKIDCVTHWGKIYLVM